MVRQRTPNVKPREVYDGTFVIGIVPVLRFVVLLLIDEHVERAHFSSSNAHFYIRSCLPFFVVDL